VPTIKTRKNNHKKLTHFKLVPLFFVAIVCMSIALIYVWFHISVTRLNYEIAQKLDRKDRLSEETRRLKVEIATLKSPSRIEAIAREKLNMDYPKKDQVIFLKR